MGQRLQPPLLPDSIYPFLDGIEDASGGRPGVSAEETVESIGRRWRELGLRPGGIVLISMPNGRELLWHFFGVLKAGGVPALVAPPTPAVRLLEIIDSFGAQALVAQRLRAERFGARAVSAVGGAQAVLFEPKGPETTSPGEVIILTSGTSGFASGCVFDFEALLLNASRHADAVGLRADDMALVSLPLYYSFALVAQVLAALGRGARVVIGGPPFHVPVYLSLLAERGVTVSSLSPVLVRMLLQYGTPMPDGLRVLTVGGDAIDPAQVEQLLRLRPGRELYLTYGLAEAGPRVSILAAHREPPRRYASVGLPLAGTKVTLDGPDGAAGPAELLVSSSTLMKRRIGRVEERRRNAWRAPGLLATGDLFEQDEEGYLFFRGRLSDFIISKGEKVCLASIRRFANSLPGVVSARIQVFEQAEGDHCFDLTLSVFDRQRASEEELGRKLDEYLRHSERPRRVRVVAYEEELNPSHK